MMGIIGGGVWVYPRVCGGSGEHAGHPVIGAGLSPRVRGKPARPSSPRWAMRSIPACAGEASPRSRSASGNSVYPRVCGGSRTSVGFLRQIAGLSPRVRGKPPGGSVIPACVGSIPACAGEAG